MEDERDTWSWLGSARATLDDFARAGTDAAPTTVAPGPGWRPDPTGLFPARYWDGAAWTERVTDRDHAPATHPIAQPYPPPENAPRRARTSQRRRPRGKTGPRATVTSATRTPSW